MYLSKQKNGNYRLRDRFISMLIVFSIMLSTIAIAGPFNIAFATNGGETEASDSGVIKFDDGDINYDSNLKDNGDGSYTLSLDVWSDVAKSDKNTRRDISENGYFVAQFDGKYLVELWGGSGASGQTTKYNKGGKGGAGGHTYGVIDLKKGDILCYNLGGKGETTLVTDEGGGANGGAAHGEKGNYKVGGGGGYSSVYLFRNGTEANSFIKNYTDGNGNLTTKVISERDRLSKYVMIAAGGGGGGAGDGFILGYKASGTADGGAGGSMTSTATHIQDGTVFNGENGKSSGKKLKYIGYGATTVPGETNGTWLDWWDGANANNWEGNVEKAKSGGGAGGAGNFRGGGGGAGFCGGSGGIMASAMVAGNIGGGGGGSSFVSDLFDYSSVSDEVKNKVNPNDGTTGSGNVNISYLGNKNDNLSNTETDWLKNLVFTANASKYFDVTASSATANVIVDGNKITLKNANLNEENGKFNLTVKFTPKAGFKGGNDVNLFEDTAKEFTISDNAGKTSSINLSDKVSYANIPLNGFEASGNDDIGISAGESVERSALFNDSYADARNNPDYTYDFIKTVSEYTVKEFDTGVEITDSSISPSVSTAYIVGFTVTPKTINPSKAVVGETVKTTEYTAGAFIDVFSEMVINGVTYNVYKKITFDKGTGKYTLSVTLKSSERPEDKDIPDGPKVNDSALSFTQDLPTTFTNQTFTSNDTFTAPVSGYYIIQAWGGNGGNGGSVAITNKGGKTREAIGGIGGTGGYVSTVVYLKKNEALTLENGAKGLNGESYKIEREGYTEYNITCDGGKAGIPTIIKSGDNVVAQASGGAGGGGGACHYKYKTGFNENKDAIFKHGTAGVSVTETTNIFDDIGSSADGSKGTASSSGVTGGIGGQTAAKNYISSELTTSTYPVAVQTVYDSLSSSNPNFTSGAAKITFVDTRKTEAEVKDDLTNRLSGIMLDTYSFTKYFKNIVVTTPTADDFANAIKINGPVDNGDGTETTTAKLGGDGITWTFTFEPKDGFLGGNYVPALESLALKQGELGAITVPENITTDFVNVEITNPITAAVNEANVKDGKYRVKYGTNVSFADLFTVTGTWPTDVDNTAFVNQIDETDIDRTSGFNATETKKFTYTYGITPTNAASKAKVAALQKEQSQTLTASVEVYSDVDVSGLKHMTYDGPTEVTYGDKLIATVKTNSGYEAPTTFTVKSGTTTLTEGNDYTYDKATGELVVNAESIKGTVYIIAEAGVKTYKIHFEATDQHGLPIVIPADKATQSFEAGAPIPAGVEPFDASAMPAKTGYKFVWDWNTDDGQPLKEMTAHDYYVYGSYEPLFYTVKINYVDTSNRPIASATQYVNENAYYTLKETVASPAIPGYKLVDPAQASVSYEVNDATIGTHNENEVILEINVKYALTEDNVTVRHIYENTGEVFAVEYAKVNVGDSYTAKAKTDVSGYTGTDKTITVSANKEENVVDILYTPNTYKIDFISEGKTIGTINATYNDVYPDFPEIENPQSADKVFAGWYTAEIGGVKIDENDIFTGTSDTTYYAHWSISPKFTVNVDPSDWTNGSVSFELTGTNDKFTYTSDNVTYQYSTDGGNTWYDIVGTEFGKFTVDAEGKTDYRFKAVAKNGDEYVNEDTYTAKIDKSAPTAKMKLSEPTGTWTKITEKIDEIFGTHFTKEKVQMEIIEAEDTLSGLDDDSSIMYFVSDGQISASDIASGTYDWKEYKSSVVINATGDDINEGKYFVYAKVTDKVGNTLYLGSDGLVVDTTAPSVGGKSNFDGDKWINSEAASDTVVISGVATDKAENGSGMDYVEYSLDGGKTWVKLPGMGSDQFEFIYSLTNDIFADGKGQTVQLRAYDLVGNASDVATFVVNKDTVNPTISVSSPVGAENAWTTSENPEITVDDQISGIKSVQYKEANETIWHDATAVDAGSGKYTAEITSNGTYTFRVIDNAGNESVESVTYSYVDSVVPTFDVTATAKSKDYDFKIAPWINDDVTFIINPTSDNDGTVTYKYRAVGTGDYTEITGTTDGKPSFAVDTQGKEVAYEIIAVSASGKKSTAATVKTSIDKVVPTGSVQLNDRTATTTLVEILDPLNLFFKDPVKVRMTYDDDLSGVASVSYYLSHSKMTEDQLREMTDGWTTYSSLFSIEENDDYIVYAKITDNAGNVTFLSSDGFIYDKVAPIIDVDLSSAKDKVNGWTVDAEIEFPVTIADNQSPKGISGVDTTAGKIAYTYDDNAPEGYKGKTVTATTATDSNGIVTFTIPNADIPAGEYKITITAYDRAGNKATADIDVMRAESSLTVIAQPTDVSVEYGTDSATFSVDVASVAGLTYRWQCMKQGETEWTDVGENSPQLVVTEPSVVGNNGDKYRVIVTSGAEISTSSDEVTLSVQKAKLTVSPNSHEKNYGQEDDPLDYTVTGYKFDDEGKVTFTGGFVREPGEDTGTYIIKNDNLALANDSANANVNGNYYTDIQPATSSYVINPYNPKDTNAYLEGTMGDNDWYVSEVKIKAPDGFLISRTNSQDDSAWSEYLTVSDDGTYNNVKYYLRNNDPNDSEFYKSITGEKFISFKIDQTAPTGTVNVDSNFWKELLSDITFGIYKNDTVTVKIDNDSSISGTKSVKYIKTSDVLTDISELEARTDWTDYNGSFNISAVDAEKFVIYVRIEDNAGNVTYLSSNGHEFDTTKPDIVVSSNITGVNDSPSYGDRIVTASDKNIDTITVTDKNGNVVAKAAINKYGTFDVIYPDTSTKVTIDGSGKISLPNDDNEYTISVADKAGNVSTKTVTMKSVDTFIDEIESELPKNPETGAPDTSLATDETLSELIDKIDDLLDKETTDKTEPSNLDSDEIQKLEEERDKLLNQIKDNTKSDLDKAAEDAKKEIDSKNDLTDKEKEDLKDEIDKALDDAKKDIDNAGSDKEIDKIVDDTKNDFDLTVDKADAIDQIEKKEKETEEAIDALPNLSDDEKSKLKDEARDEADNAIDKVNKVDGTTVDGKTPDEQLDKIVEDAKTTLDDTKDDATARDFVNKYASDNNADDPYNKTDNKVDKTNADKVISGSGTYDNHTDSVKDKINELINQGKTDGTTYPDYPSMKADADKALQDAKDAAKDDLDKAAEDAKKEIDSKNDLTDKEKEDLKDEIDKALDDAKKDIDNAGSDKEIDKIVDDTKNDFDLTVDKADAIDQIEKKEKETEEAIDALPNLSDDEKSKLKDEARDEADNAIDKVNKVDGTTVDGKTPDEQLEKIVEDAKTTLDDTKDDATARDFVNKYASDNNADDPYNKTDNKVDKTNADKVISGSGTYDNHTDSVKDKINELINQGKTDGTTYPDYPSMKADADKALRDAKDAAKDDLDKAAEDAKKEIDSKNDLTDKEKEDLKDEIDKAFDDAKKDIDNATTDDQIKDIVDETKKDFDLTVDKADAIDQIEKKEKETEAAIDALPNLSDEEKKNLKDEARAEADSAIADVNKVDGTVVDGKTPAQQLDKIVDDAKKTLDDTKDDATARDFVNKYASDNDADNPYNKTDNKVDKTNADKVISGSDIYNGHTDSVKDKINDLINQGKSDGTTYPDYPSMKLDADKALQDAKDAAKDDLDKAAEDAKKEIDSKNDLTDKEKEDLKDEIDKERDKGKEDIDNAKSDKDIDKAVEDTKKEFEDTKDDATARDFVNKYASDNNADDPYDKGNNPITDENIDKILSGSDTYDKMTDSVKDKVNGLISNQKADGSETYDSYPDMKKDAEKKAQELADKFIEDYLLPNGKTYPENSKDVYGTATKNNADQIISGKDAWDKLPKAAQDIVNSAIDAVKGTARTYPELLSEAKFIAGDKDVEFVNVDKDVSIKASGLEDLFDNSSIYTDKDKGVVAKGGHVRIENIVEKQVKSELSAADQKSSDKFLVKYGLKAGLYLEITLVKYVYEYNAETGKYVLAYTENITDTAPNKVKYVLDIPENLLGKDEYYVIRIHDGVEEIIATAPKGSTQIAFETDKFSTYILAYKEHEKETTTKTLDENRFGSVGAAFALTGVMFVATRRKKKDDESEMY